MHDVSLRGALGVAAMLRRDVQSIVRFDDSLSAFVFQQWWACAADGVRAAEDFLFRVGFACRVF